MKSSKLESRKEIDYTAGILVESITFPGVVILVSPNETLHQAHTTQFYGVYVYVPKNYLNFKIGDLELHKRSSVKFFKEILRIENI